MTTVAATRSVQRTPTVHTLLARLFAFLDDQQTAYCVVGDVRRLEDIGGDVDIVVDTQTLASFPARLTEFCALVGASLVQCLQHEVTAFYFVIAWQNDRGEWCFLPLDVCSDYYREGRRMLLARDLLAERAVRSLDGHLPRVVVPRPSQSFIYYLLKSVDKQTLGDRHGEFLTAEWHRDKRGAFAAVNRFWSAEPARLISCAADTGIWSDVCAVLPSLRAALRRRLTRVGRGPGLGELVRRVRRVARPTGLFVAVLGPDGSGKTTVVETLRRDLAPAFRRTCSFHFRPRVGGQRKPGPPVVDPHGRPSRSVPASVVKAAYYALDFVVGYAAHIRPRLVRSTLVVFDRYAHDLDADPERLRYRGPRMLAKAVGRIAPVPDVVILLDTPPAVLRSRKPELTSEDAARVAATYREIVVHLPNGAIVDAGRPLRDVVAEVERIIVRRLALRLQSRYRVVHSRGHRESA